MRSRLHVWLLRHPPGSWWWDRRECRREHTGMGEILGRMLQGKRPVLKVPNDWGQEAAMLASLIDDVLTEEPE